MAEKRKSKAEVLEDFNNRVARFVQSDAYRRNEILKSYQYRDGHQWTFEEVQKRQNANRPFTTVNLAAPIVRTVAGTEIMGEKRIDYIPLADNYNAKADIMGAVADYIGHAGGLSSERGQAAEACLLCGIGATDTGLDFSDRNIIAGKPDIQSIFPGFLIYDTAVRGGRMNDKARFGGYVTPVESDSLDEYLEEMGVEAAKMSGGGMANSEYFLNYISTQDRGSLELLATYYWWDYSKIYDTQNPFIEGGELAQIVLQDDVIANQVGEFAKSQNVNWKAQMWSFDSEAWNEYKKLIEAIQVLVDFEIDAPKASTRSGKCYYRAEIARGQVVKYGRSFTQSCFPLNFMTGYYDETLGVYYGLMRPLSEVQDELNISLSNLTEYNSDILYGGGAYITGSNVENIKAIAASRRNPAKDTPLPPNTTVTAKAAPNTAESLIGHVRLLIELMPRTVGLTEEFLGKMTSGDMTASLHGQIMEQTMAVLAHFANNSASYSTKQGKINIDIAKLWARTNMGLVIPLIRPGHTEEAYVTVAQDNLADEYSLRMVERQPTKDEEAANFDRWMALMPNLPPEVQQRVMPIIARTSPLSMKDRVDLEKAMQPIPPQPDPVGEAARQANVRMANAQAAKWEAEAQKEIQMLPLEAQETEASANQKNASAAKSAMEANQSFQMPEVSI